MGKLVFNCGLSAALEVVGGKWKPLVLWCLMAGPQRFGALRRRVVGISEKMLIQQLRELEADQLLTRHDFGEVPPRVEYAITEFGASLIAALEPLHRWGTDHLGRIEAIRGATTAPQGPDARDAARCGASGAG